MRINSFWIQKNDPEYNFRKTENTLLKKAQVREMSMENLEPSLANCSNLQKKNNNQKRNFTR